MNHENYDPDDRIAALATPWAESAIAVIRTSGEGSIQAVDTLFSKDLSILESRKMSYGIIGDPDSGESLDEIMAVPFRAPGSYTGQESVELYCHGSLPGIQKILTLLFKSGFRQASPGEFTFRAFINGKMDLTRAEAVQEIISSKSGKAQSMALNRLSGVVEKRINHLKGIATVMAAGFAIQLDYPDDEVEAPPAPIKEIAELKAGLKELIDSYKVGRIYQEGVVIALAGRTNAGKSSLFNLFLKEDRSIVSDVHGTTRDYLESWISLAGIPVRLYDTAGLRESADPIEEEGIRRTRELMDNAHLVLYVLDATVDLSDEEKALIAKEDREEILVWNKADISKTEAPEGIISVSAVSGQGFTELEEALKNSIFKDSSGLGGDAVIDSLRQKELLERALSGVDKVEEAIHNGLPVDILAMDLHDVLQALGEITGEVSSSDILDSMFSSFCVGK
ncbi:MULTISPECIES: tRNA uridine-5-carboxymethylaminomethyl(34) synthesis GTPase MnmE [unclassified Oceanispirochaeta]|uniref:tRNA uridine-5-carboxymethylaminomethyl(34) synthesis GTPase MnmE n=1 Tax=unclassified Oceanispirochaeta TaxID=2635722 RepID=UPI000E0909B7|nr:MULTISPECIES: tRNA uridine-5-carboxymethylaminomethyl(34) synthesis GTPase MnmE [unclassified Oceanispirochaeta]MBF9018512.1 tRNA uridine-5-carboxymethylaminomethyl(34) synthesis GTPase MnmE [Oceanispirochaeta sp. M2]NPD74919.1 tRNA uridine-5-carboxymethylaminomethyl(34) synthesis GTPase MnmE [Oceanispirochaeta sp. M1]RDG29250.1 tRNA uridine-5-carboxymethylaminomethyl(34) synthesis GTPase MnmE [Oceanispirochaeta sp. M1]